MTESVLNKSPSLRSLLPLWAMLVLFALPVVAAWVYYFNPGLLPDARANRGELIQPVRPWPADLPLSLGILVDTSGSMRTGDAIGASIAAASAFLDALPPEVPVGVVAAAERPSLVSPLTTDRAALRRLAFA